MCSTGEDDFGDEGGEHAMLESYDLSTSQNSEDVCKKCGVFGEIYKLKFREEECVECFLSYARHKFRAALGSSKVLPRDAKVLLIFDGTAASMVLLDMLHYAQTQNTFKRLHCFTCVWFLDELPIDTKMDEYQNYLQDVRNFLKKYMPFESFVTYIGDSNKKSFSFENLSEYFTYKKNLNEMDLPKFKSLTSNQDFRNHYMSHIIAKVALELECNFAFVSDTSTNLAAQLLSAITLGRGSGAASDVSLVDDRLDGNVKLIRPLRDLNNEEIQLYLRARKLTPLQIKVKNNEPENDNTLQSLTNAFVENLQENFPSTVSTIFRTGNKILPNSKLEKQSCVFCGSPLDFTNSPTLMAVEFSRLVSEIGEMPKLENLNLQTKVEEQLCHACRKLQFDSGGINFICNKYS